eukprot:scaffold41830_cov54-Phaeocystis_antarctica.AAC.3
MSCGDEPLLYVWSDALVVSSQRIAQAGGDGPRRQRSGLRATRGPRQRRVCSRGLGLCAMMRTRRHLGWCRRCDGSAERDAEVPLANVATPPMKTCPMGVTHDKVRTPLEIAAN